ncbi:MAG: hypothetical protein KGS73_15650, partial [Chloroflexi bacterium]|nr:hypothetical protein [Chloroflexota bacterium]
ATNTATATNTPVPTATNTATATNTPVPTATNTATATNTPVPTATNTPVLEAAAQVAEEATAAATEEPAEEATAAATEEPAEEEAPVALPSTGINISSGTSTVPVVLLALIALVVVGFVTRRRTS